ncbi:alpha/beta fold hydrolase [Nocardioides aequoreus]|uniref:alpha/beta fold hydrolase n=1 Tax=Nocardioides aequoreus TaxID=397278 RepID=UPI0004C3A40B|nr:alpha/beta fold hydrolase [Nocardioides aequoreus]
MTDAAATREHDGLRLVEHRLDVPVDHEHPDGGRLEVFAREVTAVGGEQRPWLLFLQGGPGHESPRPTTSPTAPGWLDRALRDYRVLLLDQRGTGLSTPYPSSYAAARDADPQGEAAYLRHFRADAIVRDAELLREHLGVRRWSLLGQSFGGFCALHYRSTFPDSLAETFFTGGLPPVGLPPEEIYAATFRQVAVLEARHHVRWPEDAARLAQALEACAAGEVRRPDGTALTPRLLRTVGNQLGLHGGSEALHHLLERDPRSAAFAADALALLPFGARNPLYAVVQESCYADGGATRWAAARAQPEGHEGLTGEHVFPWHFDDEPGLAPYAETARLLAEEPWPRLYDADRLADVDLPGAAAVYADDPFVLREHSEATLQVLPGVRAWTTAAYLHNGLRHAGPEVLDRLLALARDDA